MHAYLQGLFCHLADGVAIGEKLSESIEQEQQTTEAANGGNINGRRRLNENLKTFGPAADDALDRCVVMGRDHH